MAAKKKSKKRPAPRKKAVKPRPKRPVARKARPLPPVETAAELVQAEKRGFGLGKILAVLALAGGLVYFLRDSGTPTKVAAGLQVSPAPAMAQQDPKKRSTSPAGPRVWDRKKTKAPVRFYVVREKDGVAEVMLFKAGNVAVQLISSEKGPRKTVELRWDGKDAKGNIVPAGTYYARISGAHGDMVEEILVK